MSDKLTNEERAELTNQLTSFLSGFAPEEDIEQIITNTLENEEVLENFKNFKKEESKRKALADEYKKVIEEYLKDEDIHYFKEHDGDIFIVGMSAEDATFNVSIFIDAEAEAFGYNVILFKCSDSYKIPITQMLMELNSKIRYGSFVIDQMGNIVYTLSSPIVDQVISKAMFKRNLQTIMSLISQNYRKIAEALYGKFSEEDKKRWLKEIRDFAEILGK